MLLHRMAVRGTTTGKMLVLASNVFGAAAVAVVIDRINSQTGDVPQSLPGDKDNDRAWGDRCGVGSIGAPAGACFQLAALAILVGLALIRRRRRAS